MAHDLIERPATGFSIRILPEFGGRSSEKDRLASGAPEFVAETCHSSRAYDLGPKLALYQSAGVDEYLAVLVEERRFEWRILVNGSYELMNHEAGVYKSRVLPASGLTQMRSGAKIPPPSFTRWSKASHPRNIGTSSRGSSRAANRPDYNGFAPERVKHEEVNC